MSEGDRPNQALLQCQHRYQQLAQSLAQIGFIWPGTVQRRMMKCGKSRCACRTDPQARHGPYLYWTSKTKGKTVSRKLSREEGEILQQWVNNRRVIRSTLRRMIQESRRALVLLLRAKSAPR